MITDFINRIEKATTKKALDKVVQQAREKYGLWSKEYGQILSLCWDKLDKIRR